jgi:hypothetical protein
LFDGECLLSFVYPRKQTGKRWLQDPNQNNVRLEAGRYFRNKRKEHLKDKIDEL